MKDNTTKIVVFTDGASRGNPGASGYGAILIFDYPLEGVPSPEAKKKIKVLEIGAGFELSTNNRMEMTALLKSFETINERGVKGDIEIHTDSKYVHDGMMGWIYAWEKNGWKTKAGDAVLNQDIWKELLKHAFSYRLTRNINYVKVEGHAGVTGNERADEIATAFADGEKFMLFSGSLLSYEKLLGADIMADIGKIAPKSKSKKEYILYLSYVDKELKEHETWESCKARVTGVKGAKFKKVTNDEEKALTINGWKGI